CKTDRVDAWVLAELARRDLVPAIWLPDPRVRASLRLIDELDREIGKCERGRRQLGADHRYVRLLCTVPGISWARLHDRRLHDRRRARRHPLLPHAAQARRLQRSLPAGVSVWGARTERPTQQEGPAVSPLGARRSSRARLHPSDLPRPLP